MSAFFGLHLLNNVVDYSFYRNICRSDSTSYDTSSLSLCEGGIEGNIFGNCSVSVMQYWFLHEDLKECGIALATLYVNVSVWSMVGLSFMFATVISL